MRHRRKGDRAQTHDTVNSLENSAVEVLTAPVSDPCGVIQVCAVSEAIFFRSHSKASGGNRQVETTELEFAQPVAKIEDHFVAATRKDVVKP